MDAYTAIRTKSDTRNYSDRTISPDVERRILQAGRMAGSSKNTQPCRFVVLREAANRRKLASCGQFAAPLAASALAVAVILLPDGGAFDAGRAAQNMMVAAWAEGIASCPISMHNQDCAREQLGLPADHQVQIVVAFGYPDESAAPRKSHQRLPLAEFVHAERW
jgi:nitroreductase